MRWTRSASPGRADLELQPALDRAVTGALAPDVPTGLLTTEDVEARVALGFAHGQGHGWVLPFTAAVLAAGPSLRRRRTTGHATGHVDHGRPHPAVELMRVGVDAVATNDPAAVVAARSEAFAE